VVVASRVAGWRGQPRRRMHQSESRLSIKNTVFSERNAVDTFNDVGLPRPAPRTALVPVISHFRQIAGGEAGPIRKVPCSSHALLPLKPQAVQRTRIQIPCACASYAPSYVVSYNPTLGHRATVQWLCSPVPAENFGAIAFITAGISLCSSSRLNKQWHVVGSVK